MNPCYGRSVDPCSQLLKALDKGFSSKNYVRKFLRALHPKWRAKVTTIEESKDLSSLALDELIGTSKSSLEGKVDLLGNHVKRRSHSGTTDDKKGKSDRKCFRCGDPNHLIGECPKPLRNKDKKAFVGGSWSNKKNEVENKTDDETCLMASNEVTLDSSHYCDNSSSFDDDKNAKLKETQVKDVKFDKSANLLREMLNVQNSPSCKIGLGFDKSKASTSETKSISFVGLTANLAGDGSTLKADGSTIPGSID
ncbi:zf-CCHC domain-containing protein [Tanacetum coccineum]|uniref:Zf-CCHC domain-containing protein n=1 Tax=Tanacetum coccineum TaxID=301880 RepID=A0ABQ5CGM3_9ASTR